MALLVPTSRAQSQATRLSASVDFSGTTTSTAFNRKEFIASAGIAATGIIFVPSEPAVARGRATLEKSFERYFPRVQAGGEFYSKDLRKLVEQSDWSGIKLALQEPPERQKGDLNKADAGVSERARLAGGSQTHVFSLRLIFWPLPFRIILFQSKQKRCKRPLVT